MHKRTLEKADGRALVLYAREAIAPVQATGPSASRHAPQPHLRWHPLRGEWVAYASYRQNRVFLPPKEFNPLAVTTDPSAPTELPAGNYDVAVFENLSPSLSRFATEAPTTVIPARPAKGICEVVVYTQNDQTSLSQLPLWHIELLLEVWADRVAELGKLSDVQYVMPFENRGVEVGVTLHHPHGQIYAYPFVPPVPARELEEQKKHWDTHGEGLLETLIHLEINDEKRMLYVGAEAVAFVPACARYPYEVWIAPRRPATSLTELTAGERADFAKALKTTLLKYDGLWKRPFPYLMVFHQAPTDGEPHPEAHVHIELYPPYRSEHRLKYLAGTELGAGTFANDSLPEEKAAELKAIEVTLE